MSDLTEYPTKIPARVPITSFGEQINPRAALLKCEIGKCFAVDSISQSNRLRTIGYTIGVKIATRRGDGERIWVWVVETFTPHKRIKKDTKATLAAWLSKPENKEKCRVWGAKWRAKNIEKSRGYTRARRARRLNAISGSLKVMTTWESHWRRKKLATCFWCQRKVASKSCHVDHMIPLSREGRHSIENLCISCRFCNSKKWAKSIADWNAKLDHPILL